MATRGLTASRGSSSRGAASPIRGRTAIALGLLTFLVVTTSVIFRRAKGSAAATRLHQLGAHVDELRAQRTRIEAEVLRASSQGVLAPRAQRLGLKFPSDSQVIDLQAPVRR